MQYNQIHMYTTAAVQKCPTNQALKNVANIYSKSICTSHTITVHCTVYIIHSISRFMADALYIILHASVMTSLCLLTTLTIIPVCCDVVGSHLLRLR